MVSVEHCKEVLGDTFVFWCLTLSSNLLRLVFQSIASAKRLMLKHCGDKRVKWPPFISRMQKIESGNELGWRGIQDELRAAASLVERGVVRSIGKDGWIGRRKAARKKCDNTCLVI